MLKGHIAIATLVFPQGVGGAHLDAFARRALWQAGLDYDHGTGHGVGSYLSVHEGPVSLSRLARPVPIARRHDPVERARLLRCRPLTASGWRTCCWCSRRTPPDATKPFLRFETLTLAPFDRRLIEPALLTLDESAWLECLSRTGAGGGRADAAGRRAEMARFRLRSAHEYVREKKLRRALTHPAAGRGRLHRPRVGRGVAGSG